MLTFNLIIRALLFYLIPLGVGHGVSSWLRLPWMTDRSPASPLQLTPVLTGGKQAGHVAACDHSLIHLLSASTINFAFGSLLILGWALLSQGLQHLLPGSFTLLFFGGTYILFLCACISVVLALLHRPVPSLSAVLALRCLGYPLLAVGGALWASWLWQKTTATPLNWDLFEHQTLATIIQTGRFHFFTSQLSDTFGFASYPPTFHALLALSQFGLVLTPVTILSYWQWLGVVHAVSVALATYLLALVITQKRLVALSSAWLSVLVFEGVMAFTALFALPQNLTAALFAGLLATIIWYQYHHHLTRTIVLIGLPALVLNHYIVGSAGALLLAAVALIPVLWQRLTPTQRRWFWPGLIGLASVALVSSYALDLSFINRGEAATFTFSFIQKLRYLAQMYALLPAFWLAGIVWLIRGRRYTLDRTRAFLLITLALLAIILSGIPYAFKFLTLFHFPFIIAATLGLAWLSKSLPRWWLPTLVLVLGTSLALATRAQWQNDLLMAGFARHVSEDELEAATYLQTHYSPTSTLLISDPATQYILEGLSGLNSVGGVFSPVPLRATLSQQYTEGSLNLAKLAQIQDGLTSAPQQRLLILSGRTFEWLAQQPAQTPSMSIPVWRPQSLPLYDNGLIEMYLAKTPLPVVYRNASLVIIALPR